MIRLGPIGAGYLHLVHYVIRIGLERAQSFVIIWARRRLLIFINESPLTFSGEGCGSWFDCWGRTRVGIFFSMMSLTFFPVSSSSALLGWGLCDEGVHGKVLKGSWGCCAGNGDIDQVQWWMGEVVHDGVFWVF